MLHLLLGAVAAVSLGRCTSSTADASPPAAPTSALTRCQQMVVAARASQRSASPPPSVCVEGSDDRQRELEPVLTGAVQGAAEGRVAQVEFPCTSVSGEPADVRAFIVGGHGGDARLIGITRLGADRFRARSASVATGGGPNRAPSGPVEFLRQELPATVLVPAFDRMRTALAARITTTNRLPQTPTTLQPIGVSSASSSIELALRDTRGRVAVRSWQGYHGTVGAEDRVPIELAWQTLRETLSAIASAPASDPEPEDRALLAHAWRQRAVGYERSWYATRALLLFAARAGSPDLIPLLLPQLDADDPDLRRLAVDALAAITEHDARRDPSGNARPLEDVVAEYRRECSYPTQSR